MDYDDGRVLFRMTLDSCGMELSCTRSIWVDGYIEAYVVDFHLNDGWIGFIVSQNDTCWEFESEFAALIGGICHVNSLYSVFRYVYRQIMDNESVRRRVVREALGNSKPGGANVSAA